MRGKYKTQVTEPYYMQWPLKTVICFSLTLVFTIFVWTQLYQKAPQINNETHFELHNTYTQRWDTREKKFYELPNKLKVILLRLKNESEIRYDYGYGQET